jgi:hypothetical protein
MSQITNMIAATAMLASISPAFGDCGVGNTKKLIPNRAWLNQRQKRKNNRRAIANGFKLTTK